MITHPCKPGLTVRTIANHLEILNAAGLIGSQGSSGRGTLNHQRKGRHGYHNGKQLKQHQSNLTHETCDVDIKLIMVFL